MTSNEEQPGWRLSTHLAIAWTILIVGASLYDLIGPDRYDDAGEKINGLWAGRAVIAWIASMVILGAYRRFTSRQDRSPIPPASHLDELEKLGTLREKGVLSAEEFDAEKRKLLDPSRVRN